MWLREDVELQYTGQQSKVYELIASIETSDRTRQRHERHGIQKPAMIIESRDQALSRQEKAAPRSWFIEFLEEPAAKVQSMFRLGWRDSTSSSKRGLREGCTSQEWGTYHATGHSWSMDGPRAKHAAQLKISSEDTRSSNGRTCICYCISAYKHNSLYFIFMGTSTIYVVWPIDDQGGAVAIVSRRSLSKSSAAKLSEAIVACLHHAMKERTYRGKTI
ncbi:hypothetical protein EDD37DRAFT_59924 [Exophiala viscosa]|uniref:Uncharacterized protein n=1 Tax=Exophiala viscosa TaxID=2486360 RepID=A0AAN6IGM6_9EURO|nr:hypothetical protein EDD36DRAFT_147423 [Exophiala viscosa]KAI1629606.1 hypothetical protein EDD37DRAFT_59924 [Exophiala viscosa]